MSASRPGSLMIPTFTGRSTVTRSPRSGMKAREGTPRKRLLSTIHAEYFGARSAICASLKRSRVLSKPCGKVCGGRLPSSARPPSSRSSASSPPRLSRSSARAVALTAAPTSTTNPRATVALTTLRIILHLLIGRVALRRTLHDVRLPFASPFHAEAAGPPRRLVGRKLVGPELRPDLPDLVGPFEAKRVRGAQVFLA